MKKFNILKVFIFVGVLLSVGLGVVFPAEKPRTREEQKVAVWINQLGDEDPKVREDAALSLKKFVVFPFPEPNIEDIEVEKLFQALDDPNPKVRVGALSFLSYLGGRGLVQKQKVDATRVEKLMQILDDSEPKVRVEVLSFLRHLGGREIVEKVKLRLKDEDAEVRTKAAVALFRLRPLGDIGSLIAAAEDENDWVRCGAAEALGLSKYPEAYQVLLRLCEDKSQSVRYCAVTALGDYGDKRAEPVLLTALNDPNPKIRWGAAYALGHIGEKESISPLVELLKKKDVEVKGGLHDIVNFALFKITLQEDLEGYESWNNWWKANKDSFDPVEEVRELLQSEKGCFPAFRRIAYHRKMEELRPELRSMLSEKDNIKGLVSAGILAKWGDLDGLAYFFSALKRDRSLNVLGWLSELTGQFFYGDPEAWLKWWQDNKSRIRWNEKHHIFEVVEEAG